MTVKKTQKVKISKDNAPKKKIKFGDTITDKEKKALDGFFEQLKKSVNDTAKEMGINLHCKEPHHYYVTYSSLTKDGDHSIGCSCFTTDLNVFERHGAGLKILAQKFEVEKDLKSVIILNVIKLED